MQPSLNFAASKLFLWLLILVSAPTEAQSIFDSLYNPSNRSMPEGSILIGELSSETDRNVYLKDSQAFIFSEVPKNETIYNMDSIFVGPRGNAKIKLSEEFGGGELTLTPNTVITISKVGTKEVTPVIELKKGSLAVARAPSPPGTNLKAKPRPKKSFIVQSGAKAVVLKPEPETQIVKVTATEPLEVLQAPSNSTTGTSPLPNSSVEVFDSGDLILSLEKGKSIDDIVEKKVTLTKSPIIAQSAPTTKTQTILPKSKSLLLGSYVAPQQSPDSEPETISEPVSVRTSEAAPSPIVAKTPSPKPKRTTPVKQEENVKAAEAVDSQNLLMAESSKADEPTNLPYRFDALVGGALIKQSLNSSSGSSRANNLGYRLRFSWHYSEVMQFTVRHLGTLTNTNPETNNKVSWTVLSSEFRVHENSGNAPFWIPNLRLVAGVERFNNSISSSTASTEYIASYSSVLAGFRSRFILDEEWEIGGDFLSTLLSNGFKMHVQGDLNYRINSTYSVGGGYWLEYASISSNQVSETTFALESYLQARF